MLPLTAACDDRVDVHRVDLAGQSIACRGIFGRA
jgi:hypothetical protein